MQAVLETHNAATSTRSGKYLVFHLGEEEFGVHVLTVREIMGIQDVTAVPETPNFVKGVINLRGKVIPVVDLRLKFGMHEVDYTPQTCIVVIEFSTNTARMMIGIIVDGVSEVLNLQDAEIEDVPHFGEDLDLGYILGMAKVKGKVKILLAIDQVLSRQDLSRIEHLSGLK